MADELAPESQRRRKSRRERRKREFAQPIALTVFALLVTLGPLAFGAVDRVIQIALTALLGIGMLAVPPRIIPLPAWMNRVLIAIFAILVLKELAPARLFGSVSWRSTLEQAYSLALPWTHHPEPGRAFDGWLVGAVAIGWLAWVRTLAIERENRTRLAWVMFLAGVIVAAVSFATANVEPKMIYGLRYTQGWTGFGPFPNRNHSACFFALAAVIGAGCLARSGERKRYGLVVLSAVMEGVLVTALLSTRSRGGLLALAVGLIFFLGVVVLKLRTRKALGIAAAATLLVGGLSLVAGGKTIQRVAGTGSTQDESAATRVAVWHNAATMWKDAPLLGHGVNSFASIFPMYQQISMEEVSVKHPESSWLQWLVELGLIPVVLIGVAGLVFAAPNVGALFERHSSFFIRAACFGAVATLLTHALFDVPAHRWGTAAFALAALAIACPAAADSLRAPRFAAIVPFGVAAFWVLPIWVEWPVWSPFQLDRLLATSGFPPGIPTSEIEASLRCFPLNPQLHQDRGERLLRAGAQPPAKWQNELRLAARLMPNSWQICARTARLCRTVQPSMAYSFWQMAIERATRQRVEVFSTALRETADLRGAAEMWRSYAEVHPDLALLYSEGLSDEAGRPFYELWWGKRGASTAEIPEGESATFLRVASRWGNADQLTAWAQQHPERSAADFRAWAALLHGWNEDEKAWGLIRREVQEPSFPTTPSRLQRTDLEFRWRHNPDDIVNARSYAQFLELHGETAESEKVILSVARRADAPKWFLEKAAYQLAKARRFDEAVELAMRQPKVPAAPSPAAAPDSEQPVESK